MKKLLLILITLFTAVIGYSQAFFVTDTYGNSLRCGVISTNTVAITAGGTINNANVDIPASVSNAGTTYSVTEIASNTFSGTAVSSVSIPNTVTSIGQSAFINTNLTSLVLPSNLVTIGDYAFQANQLTELTIPSNVTNIGIGAFRSNNSLTTVTCLATVPPTITTANNLNDTFYDGFTGDRSDIDLIIPAGTIGAYVTDSGALWTGFNSVTEALIVGDTFIEDYITYEVTSTTPNTVMIRDYDMNGGSDVIIPATVNYNNIITFNVTVIHTNSFISNPITNVIIPNSIVQIRSGAFFGNQFTSVVIPSSVTSIGGQAFAGNNFLTSVVSEATTPPTILTGGNGDTFGEGGFGTRSNINLVLPNGTTDEYVTDGGALWTGFKMVFEATSATTLEVTDYDAANGTSVSIPATITDSYSNVYNITEIGNAAFFSKGLTSVTIPNGVTSIGVSAFNTNNLTSLTIPDSVITISSQAFVTNDLTNVTFGNSLTSIEFGAFADNDLTSVTLPSSVTTIGSIAFAANPLTSVTSLATTPPTITTGTNDTFHISGDRSGIDLTIPTGTESAYIAATWINFASVSLDVSDFELENGIKIITDEDAIKVVSSNNVRLENYTIYNLSGVKVATGKENEIATNTFASGIYILKLDFDKETVVKKVAIN